MVTLVWGSLRLTPISTHTKVGTLHETLMVPPLKQFPGLFVAE